MNASEIPRLLAEIALADPRVRRDDPAERRSQIAMWARILTDVPYDAAVQAVAQHYATSTYPILPADIATRWKAAVRHRLARHTDPDPPVHPDDELAWRRALKHRRQLVAAGDLPPTEHIAAQGSRPVGEILPAVGKNVPRPYMPANIRTALADILPGRAAREQVTTAGAADPLSVNCPWCRARAGDSCRRQGHGAKWHRRDTPHPSRIEAAQEATR